MSTLQHDTTTAAKTDHARQDQFTGAALKAVRETLGLTTRVMATEAGCSPAHLSRIESGERALTEDLASRIARAIADQLTRLTTV